MIQQTESQTHREGVEEDTQEEQEQEEEDEEEDQPLKTSPQDELQRFVRRGKPEERGLRTSVRRRRKRRGMKVTVTAMCHCYDYMCVCVCLTEGPPGVGSCWVHLCPVQQDAPPAPAPSPSPESSPLCPVTATTQVT